MIYYLHVFMEVLYHLNRGWADVDDFIRLLRRLKIDIRNERVGAVNELRTLYLMIPYCRDIIRGKGERDVSYRIIYAFYQVFPILAIKAVHLLFHVREGLPMVGSWCDIKYFCVFIERYSYYGSTDPLIATMVSIANRNIDKDEVAKWIPRESHHPYLFSIFARNFFNGEDTSGSSVKKGLYLCDPLGAKTQLPYISSGHKGIYRKRISRDPKGPKGPVSGSPGLFPSWFMGKYVREALRLIKSDIVHGEPVEAIERGWRRLLQSFPHYIKYGIAIVDLDIGIPDEVLFHSIGFACLIAEKMGLKRIILAGVVPTCVDVSSCGGLVGMVRVLWSYCEGRGVSRLGEAADLVKRGFNYIGDSELLVFIFSARFSFDWHSVMNSRCVPVFWNIGNNFEIPVDFYVDYKHPAVPFIYMSGYASGLLIPFFSCKLDFYGEIMGGYSDWTAYFDLFISMTKLEFEEQLKIPNNLSLGQI